jgi:HD-GYP domain-containing protein (c-di-GMP phosphodiesterase class II)
LTSTEQNNNFHKINCCLAKETVYTVVESIKMFILSIENEAEVDLNGLLETRDILLKEVQDKASKLNSLREIRIDEHYHISHNINVASIATILGVKIGLKQDELKLLMLAGLVHDVGKIKIPIQILLKPDKLTSKEFELVKLHVPLGYKIVKDEIGLHKTVCRTVMEHHERYDGSGYPRRLSGHDQHQFSQIIAVADIFDALSSNRVYAKPKTPAEIVKEMLAVSYAFNPLILHTLIHMIRFSI